MCIPAVQLVVVMSQGDKFLDNCLWALTNPKDDASFSSLLQTMLPRVITYLRNDALRSEALEVIKTVNTRVKNTPAVRLPLRELLQVFNASEATPYEKNFAMVFLESGWQRGSPEELGALIPLICSGISK